MQTRYIPAVSMLIAGAVTSIISIIMGFDTLHSLKVLLIVLIVFYIIGLIAKNIIVKVTVNMNPRISQDIDDALSDIEDEESNEDLI